MVDVPLIGQLNDGELAVVLTWTQGSQVLDRQVELQDLDLHIEFQPSDTI